MCFQLEDHPILFSGDTLFPGGPGNTTFEGGDFATIIESLDRRLFTLPADTIVLPGHGDRTTIGADRPHPQESTDSGWCGERHGLRVPLPPASRRPHTAPLRRPVPHPHPPTPHPTPNLLCAP